MKNSEPGDREAKLETAVSYVLIAGVVASLLLELAGIVLFYRTYGELAVSRAPSMFIRGRNFFSFIYEQLFHHTGGSASLFMIAGIIVLALTPYLRVVMSVFFFAWQKDSKYLLITLFVLLVLTGSLLLH